MAKVDEATLTPDAVASSRKRMMVARTKHGTVIKAWPRKRPGGMTPGRFYHEQEFKLAAQWASNPNNVDARASMQMTADTTNVPRDLRMMAIYGTLYEISRPEGGMAVRYRDVTTNAQLVLDQVTDVPGSMMWRSPSGWIQIPPGSDNQVLLMLGQVPAWHDLQPLNTNTLVNNQWSVRRPTVNSAVPINTVQGTGGIIHSGTVITGIEFYANNTVATSKVAAVLYQRNGNIPGTLLALGPQVTGIVQGVNRIAFNTPVAIGTTDWYFLGAHVAVASFNQPTDDSVTWAWGSTQSYPPPSNPTITESFVTNFLKPNPY